MKKKLAFFLVILFFFSINLFLSEASAIFLELSETQINEAIDYGKKNRRTSLGDFSRQWSVYAGDKTGWATLYTSFHNLAYKARKATIEHKELLPKQINKILEPDGTLTFTVSILGNEIHFAQGYHARLKSNNLVIPPTFEHTPEFAEPSTFWPEMPDHVAGCVFKFPIKDINPDSLVTLILTDLDGASVEFPFDLSKMK